MTETDWIDSTIAGIADKLLTCNRCELRRKTAKDEYGVPIRKAVHDALDTLIGILFPGCHGHGPIAEGKLDIGLQEQLGSIIRTLQEQIAVAFKYQEEPDDFNNKAADTVRYLVESLPGIQEMLQEDIQAAYDGDPAAKSAMEIVMSYPAIQAISTYRIAHPLYEKKVPLIPRIMTELAHSRTGIDIHPGAEIGRSFFIDHGTGVVIGETTVIGNNVKIYQGVTLGALSFPKDKDGKLIKGIKRHPHVSDNVTIYAGATILGNITIGEGSTIGGNVWLTHSVPLNSKVSNVQPKPQITQDEKTNYSG